MSSFVNWSCYDLILRNSTPEIESKQTDYKTIIILVLLFHWESVNCIGINEKVPWDGIIQCDYVPLRSGGWNHFVIEWWTICLFQTVELRNPVMHNLWIVFEIKRDQVYEITNIQCASDMYIAVLYYSHGS